MSNSQNPQALGDRFNEGKTKWSLFPFEAAREIVKVLEFGAKKYGSHNWQKGLVFSETFESLQRHILAWYNGEDKDEETGLSHLAHAGCNILFLIWFSINNRGVDDRPNKKTCDVGFIPTGRKVCEYPNGIW